MTGDRHTVTAARPDHVAGFYDSDDDLVAGAVPFLADGLAAGDAVVVVATPAHLASFEAALAGRGIPLDGVRREGRFVALDAHLALAALTAGGTVRRDRFRTVIGTAVADVARRAPRVHAFGEMVGLLWADGDVAGALALESFWNELCDVHELSLWCAYPATSLPDADLGAVAGVCSQHSHVVAPGDDAPATVAQVVSRGPRQSSQLFLPTPAAAGAVRRFVYRTLESWDAVGVSSSAVLVASELATNAVVHAGSPFRVTLRRSGTSVTIAVDDCDRSEPRRAHRGPDALSGRGIVIVAGVSSGWGTEVRADGKTVWATVTATT